MKSQHRSPYKEALDKLYNYLSGFVSLTAAEFIQILPYLEIREYEKKAVVVQTGDTEKYINLIVRGLTRKYMTVKNDEITLQLATEGHVVYSELSFHTQAQSGCAIETIETTTFISISYDSMQQLYEEFPKGERLGRLLMSDMFVKKDFHFFDRLQKNTRERFLEYIKTHPHVLQRVPQKYIASYLNIKPETFSRLKHLLQPKKSSRS